MTLRGYLAVVLVLSVACAAAAGCGGSGDETTSQSTEPAASGTTKEVTSQKPPSFAEQANTICRNAESEREKVVTEATEEGKDSDQASLVTEVALPPIQKMIEELKALTPPKGDEKKVQAIIAAFEKGVVELEANPADFAADVNAFAKADRLAEEYGLTDCGI
jgi:hypothetical protein